KGKGVAVFRLPIGADALGRKVRTLVDREVLASDSRTRQLGAELHALLLKPLAERLAGKDLVIVPDGVLWELPFELLVEGASADDEGKYLVETRRLRYATSMTALHFLGLWEKKRGEPKQA